MTKKYRVTFADGKQATMLDMEERGLAYARESVSARFGAHHVTRVEEANHEQESAARPEDDRKAETRDAAAR